MIKMNRKILFGIIILILFIPPVFSKVKLSGVQTFDIEDPEKMTLKMENRNGSIWLTGWDSSHIKFEYEKVGKTRKFAEATLIYFNELDDSIKVWVKVPKTKSHAFHLFGGGNTAANVNFNVYLPKNLCIADVKSRNGKLSINGFYGQIKCNTRNGGIKIKDAGKNILADTRNGGIKILNADENITAETTNGSVKITCRNGGVQSKSVNGSINLTVLEKLKSEINAKTVNGTVYLDMPEDINCNVNLKTTNGSVRCEFPVTVSGKLKKNRLNGTIGSGGVLVNAKTVNGKVVLE
jgi:DUF4097 and DUF4098 domain-containing protein YvlB